jgi:hypothetical protein
MSDVGVKAYQTVAERPAQNGSSGATVASRVSAVSVNGTVGMTVAPEISSLGGGTAQAYVAHNSKVRAETLDNDSRSVDIARIHQPPPADMAHGSRSA